MTANDRRGAISEASVSGDVAPGFEGVARAFEENFATRGEVGAAFAAYRDGKVVVDLWGGRTDHESPTPWRRDTLILVFSGTKGMVALCLLLLIERGLLDLGAPMSHYWPELGAHGKSRLLVSHVVSHRSGLPGVQVPLSEEDLFDWGRMVSLLEAQVPYWEPGERVCYHPMTYGWLCGELLRRIDGRSIGRFFAEEVAAPLGLDAWIGLPEELEPRVATIGMRMQAAPSPEHLRAQEDPLAASVWENPPARDYQPMLVNTTAFRTAEFPGANAIVDARSMARLYGCLASGGSLDGVRLLSSETVALGRRCLSRGRDALLGDPPAFGVGFALQTEVMLLGPVDDAFGHGGAGGSIHGAWPDQGVGFSYAMNDLRNPKPDPRAQALLSALHEAVTKR